MSRRCLCFPGSGSTPPIAASGLSRLADPDDDSGLPPYWAYQWAGGMVLARYIFDHPATVAGRRVLDLGAGCGIVGIAAALAGAGEVIAADTDRNAAAALELNAAMNGVALTVVGDDLTAGPPPAVDLVLAGDVYYDPGLALRVTAFLDRCVAAGIEVLIGDPGRAYLPRTGCASLPNIRCRISAWAWMPP